MCKKAAGVQDQKATKDAVATTVGVIIFWPALFMISGNDEQTAELARLRGKMEALEEVAIRKKCGIKFQKELPASAPTSPVARSAAFLYVAVSAFELVGAMHVA